jgi:serine protease Do
VVLQTATLGNSDAVDVGDPVFAIGHPFSQDSTVTTGIVSATGRVMESSFTGRRILNVIQTDASLNPGNSGGPLFNDAGEVIGINTSITGPNNFRGSVGLGFAVPSNIALRFLLQMLAGDTVRRTELGVGGETLDEVIAAENGFSITRGFAKSAVGRWTPASNPVTSSPTSPVSRSSPSRTSRSRSTATRSATKSCSPSSAEAQNWS